MISPESHVKTANRPWKAAWVVVALIAAGQLAWALVVPPHSAPQGQAPQLTDGSIPEPKPRAVLVAPPAPVVDEANPFAYADAPPAPVVSLDRQATRPASPTSAPIALEPPAPLDTAIEDEEIITHLDQGMSMRSRGDSQSALIHFRAALLKLPEHPRLLYQLALTLDTMGLFRKAQPFWQQLRELGPGTGDYHSLATTRLVKGIPVTSEPEEQIEGKLTIRDLKEERLPDAVDGERIKFTLTIKKKVREPIDIEKDVLWNIHFFDTVNGRRIARSCAQAPVLVPESPPVDWADSLERFTFEYWQPEMTPEELIRFGRCRYYGCTVEVTAFHKLQDVTATTPELREIARELPLPDALPAEDLLHGPGVPSDTPDATLFPTDILRK